MASCSPRSGRSRHRGIPCGHERRRLAEYFEEHRKDTLEAGKLADMVILSEDPLAVDSQKIDQIEVLETIKEGKRIDPDHPG